MFVANLVEVDIVVFSTAVKYTYLRLWNPKKNISTKTLTSITITSLQYVVYVFLSIYVKLYTFSSYCNSYLMCMFKNILNRKQETLNLNIVNRTKTYLNINFHTLSMKFNYYLSLLCSINVIKR